MGWLTLCKKDPLLNLIRGQLGSCNLLRRPSVNLRPLDVFMLLEDGWFAPPQLVRVGPLQDLLVRGTSLRDSVVSTAPVPGIQAARSDAVDQKLAFDLLDSFGHPADISSATAGHQYSGNDKLFISFQGVEQSSADLALVNQRGYAPKLDTKAVAIRTALEREATLLLVDTVLYAKGMQAECVQNLKPSYSITYGGGANAGWSLQRQNAYQATGAIEKLAFAFSCVRLNIDPLDGTFYFVAGPRGQVMSDGAAGSAFEHVQVWPEDIACDLGAASEQQSDRQATGLGARSHALQVNWPNASMAPAWDAGTTDLKLGNKLVGLAFVANLNGATSEDTLTDEAESGYRRSQANVSQSAVDSKANSGHEFESRSDFQARVWSCLGISEESRAIYQRARNVASRYPKANAALACTQLSAKIGSFEEVVRLNGVEKYNAAAHASGLVFFGPMKAAGSGEATRKIWQVVPESMGLPPSRAVTIESVADSADAPQLLKELVAKLQDGDQLVIVECDCIVRLVQHSWQLRNAELP